MPALCRALSPLCCCFVCRRSVLSSVIGDPELDSEEQALQAELATYDQRLEQLHEEHSQRRAATPTLGAPPSTPGMSGVVSQQPAAGPAAEQAATPQHPPPQEQQEEHQVLQQDRLLEQEREETQLPDPAAPTIPPSELSIVRCVTTATAPAARMSLRRTAQRRRQQEPAGPRAATVCCSWSRLASCSCGAATRKWLGTAWHE